MRIQCPQCKELFDCLGARVDAGAVHFSCTHCKSAASLPLDKSAASLPLDKSAASLSLDKSAASLPLDKSAASLPLGNPKQDTAASANPCPKCAAGTAPGAKACKSCGLAAALFADYQADEGSDALEEAWLRLQDDWHSDDEHESFMGHVAGSGDFRGGAARYRRSEIDPSRAERSRKMLDRIQSMATAALLSSKPKVAEVKEPFQGVVVLLVVLVMFATIGGIYFVVVKSKTQPSVERHFRGGTEALPTPKPRPPQLQPGSKSPGESSR